MLLVMRAILACLSSQDFFTLNVKFFYSNVHQKTTGKGSEVRDTILVRAHD